MESGEPDPNCVFSVIGALDEPRSDVSILRHLVLYVVDPARDWVESPRTYALDENVVWHAEGTDMGRHLRGGAQCIGLWSRPWEAVEEPATFDAVGLAQTLQHDGDDFSSSGTSSPFCIFSLA